MGYTLKKWPYTLNRTNYKKTISDLLEDVLVNDICDENIYHKTDYGVDEKEETSRHLNAISNTVSSNDYYDVLRIKEIKIKRRIYAYIFSIIGFDKAKQIRRML